LKIKDLNDVGSCLIAVPSFTTDQVQQMSYCRSKRLVMMASRDGKLQVWELPTEWREKWADKKEQDYLI
jgi:hypothetical protein